MISKERVKRAFHFNKPDRVPKLVFNLNTDFYPVFLVESENFQPTNYPPHTFGGPQAYASRRLAYPYEWSDQCRINLGLPEDWWNYEINGALLTIDEWGLIWKSGAANRDPTMGHPYKGPFQESWDGLEEYEFPDPYDESRYRGWNKTAKDNAENRYLMGILSIAFIHNLSSFLRGFDYIMIDFVRNPKKVHKLINIITDIFAKEVELLKQKVPELDAMFFLDDLGTQKSPVISPNLFKKFYYDPYKKIINLTHDLGMDFILHCCGQIKELLPIFYELGIDVLEFDSPNMTGVENFKEYAQQQKIAFWLSCDIQSTYPLGTPLDIENEIKSYIREIGNNQGGLAFYEYIAYETLKVPKKNVRAFRKAMDKWGIYNQQGIIDWLS